MRWLLEKYDWLVYRLFNRSFNRFFGRNIGFCYLLLYQTQAFIEQEDPKGELAHSSRQFWDAMQEANQRKETP